MSHEQKTPKLASIPSCGLALLRGPLDSFDYVLRITSNEKTFVHINCHRCVLLAHSKKMSDLIRNENFWDMDIKVRPGYISAVIELIQYMYLKDISLVTEKSKILELCGLFEMPLDFFLIRTESLDYLNQYPTIQLNIEPDDSSCITTLDFLKRVTVEKAKLTAPILPPPTVINSTTSILNIPLSKNTKSRKRSRENHSLIKLPGSLHASKEVTLECQSPKYNLRRYKNS
jgi:hypothetical protein